MEDGGVVGRVEEDLSDDLTGRNLISRLDINPVQVTIDGEVITMTDNHRIVEAGDGEDTGNDTVEDGTGLGTRIRQDIDSVVVGTNMFEGGMLMLSELTHDAMRVTGDRVGQTSAILGEIIRQGLFLLRHGISSLHIRLPFFQRCGSRSLFLVLPDSRLTGFPFTLSLGDLFGDLLFDHPVQLVGLFLLLLQLSLEQRLLLAQLGDLILLALFFDLQFLLFLFTACQQTRFLFAGLLQLQLLTVDLRLTGDDIGSLPFLPLGIFAEVTHPAERLPKAFGRKDKQQLVLRGMPAIHTAYRLAIALLLLLQLVLEDTDLFPHVGNLDIDRLHLLVQQTDHLLTRQDLLGNQLQAAGYVFLRRLCLLQQLSGLTDLFQRLFPLLLQFAYPRRLLAPYRTGKQQTYQ